MRAFIRLLAVVPLFFVLSSRCSHAANLRGQLLCNGGNSAAVGMAVTLLSPQFGRTTTFFTGGDGMYYLNVPAGSYTLEIWTSRQINAPTLSYPIVVGEPMTDIPRIFLAACYPM